MTRVAIIGGGIGRGTAGCALAQSGLEVSVYESAPELKQIGAGVALPPNAMRVLKMIGVEGEVRRLAGHSEFSVTRNGRTGPVISKISRARQAESFGISGATISRPGCLPGDEHGAVLATALAAETGERGLWAPSLGLPRALHPPRSKALAPLGPGARRDSNVQRQGV